LTGTDQALAPGPASELATELATGLATGLATADRLEAAVQDEARRVRLGADEHAGASMLKDLTADRSVTVRAALALNPASPPQVNRLLARDPDERVRVLLARRLASLLPALAADAQVRLQRQVYEILTTLVTDTAVRVRAAVADVLKEMPQAPRALILLLAQDEAVMVSTPIVLFSPLLTQEDLLALIAQAPSAGTTIAVARRPGIDMRVSDAVAATADSAAICALLSNPTAQIREATLDALVAVASGHLDWHEPLVRRPRLPPRAARALADIVATHLLEVLAQRSDLPPELAEDLRGRLTARLGGPEPPRRPGETTREAALAEAEALARSGGLNEEAIVTASRRGDARLAAALLAVAADVPVSVVERAASLRSAKGFVSLVWQAGFSMQVAVALQTLLGRLRPDAVLSAGQGGGFPLGVEEMRWQLDFLRRVGR
jgi:uncharacterized protein (DUF2336 family)